MRFLRGTHDWMTEASLARRSVAAVLLAFVVVWAVLLGYIYLQAQRTLANDPNLQKFGDALVHSLTDVQEPAQASAVVAATAKWVNLRRRQVDIFPGVYLFELLSPDGQRLYASPTLQPQELTSPSRPMAEVTLHGRIHRVYEGRANLWTLRIAEPKRSDAELLSHNGRLLLPYLALAAPFVLLPVWLSVQFGLRPLQRLTQRIEKRDPDDLSPVGVEAHHRELKPLVDALDTLLLRLRQKVNRERAFVQDAAHEIRTPLAVITAQAHVMARAAEPHERRQAQAHLDHAIARTSHLAQQLLDLAALDEAQRSAAQTIDIAQWLRHALAQPAATAMGRQIDVSLDAPDSLVRTADLPALESIVHNLVDNAIRYGREAGLVAISLREENGALVLAVQDDGPGIPLADQAKVFERFYRGSGHEAAGSGLGLAIVRQAALRMGADVRIVQGLNGKGVGFLVSIPAHGARIAA